MVVVAQLVRALDCGSRGRRFEPGLPPKQKAAQRAAFCLAKLQRFNNLKAMSFPIPSL